MSRRAIKRFEQALEAGNNSTQSKPLDTPSSDDPSTPIESPPTQRQGLFSLLDVDDNESDDNENSHEETDHITTASEPMPTNQSDLDTNPEPSLIEDPVEDQSVAKKKKKKKRRKARKRRDNVESREDDPDWIALNEAENEMREESHPAPLGWIPNSYFASDDDDDVREEAKRIMAFVENLVKSSQIAEQDTPATNSNSLKVLHVEPRLLNADTELKRLFGSRVVESERRVEDSANSNVARRRARAGGRAIRRNISLVTPRENWFDHAPGLIMEIDTEGCEQSSESGVRYYKYSHEGAYARVQEEYRVLVNMHDPNMLVKLLEQHPFHVDTLLQLAELYRQMGELDTAAEYIERCLYILEGSWNVSFKPFDGTCRVRFDVLENRSLYIALFRYSQLLTRRGLHRTSLEMSKLLLNLDPKNDPMGMLMLADSYALLSSEYKWVEEVFEKYRMIPVEYFPNFAASRALAYESIRLGLSGISNRGSSSKGKKNGNKDNHGRDEMGKADEVLTDAILTFPMILRPLLSALEDNSTVWAESRLFDEPWYSAGYAAHADSGVLNRMARVYAERSKLLWNSPGNKEMLLRCARRAGALDNEAGLGRDPETGRPSSAFVSDESKHARVAGCRAKRTEAAAWFATSGLYQNVQIADFTDSTTNLPAEILAGDGADQPVGAQQPREVSMARGALEFLQSMLPWREARDAEDPTE